LSLEKKLKGRHWKDEISALTSVSLGSTGDLLSVPFIRSTEKRGRNLFFEECSLHIPLREKCSQLALAENIVVIGLFLHLYKLRQNVVDRQGNFSTNWRANCWLLACYLYLHQQFAIFEFKIFSNFCGDTNIKLVTIIFAADAAIYDFLR
jgi:hypothetical protein